MKVLYAEDERALSMAVTEILRMEEYEVDAVYDGAEALEHINDGDYDAIVLDIMMPKLDGIGVLETMRKNNDYTPVMLLTAKTQVEDKIKGLTIGADDYLSKPFEMGEFLARLHSLIRRNEDYQDKILSFGNVSLNCDNNELTSPISRLQLSSDESKLLACLVKRMEAGISKDRLRESIFSNAPDNQIVDLYLSYIKNKLTQLQSELNIKEESGKIYLQS